MLNRSNNPRELLAKLRLGDYAHAGDQESIDIVMRKVNDFEHNSERKITADRQALDVGCGRGGTANYIQNNSNYQVSGIDIDNIALQHAASHYPSIRFFDCNILALDKKFSQNQFDFIYMFNVFYAIHEKEISLKNLAHIAKPGAMLVIFDYTTTICNQTYHMQDLAGKAMYPIYPNQLLKILADTGWLVIEFTDLTDKFINWYEDLLTKLANNRNSILDEFTQPTFEYVQLTFKTLLEDMQKNILGGGVWYAKRTLLPSPR